MIFMFVQSFPDGFIKKWRENFYGFKNRIYGIYCDGKIFGVVCKDQLFLKITKKGKELFPKLEEAPPYEGAKNYLLVEDVEDKEMLTKLALITCAQLPEPKKKKG